MSTDQKIRAEANFEVLVVEDSPTQTERLRFILERHGYHFFAARDGLDALAFLAKRKTALVISDVVMPQMDGYELCCRIKRDETFKAIPVILLTSLSDPIDVVRGLECGADNFIFKPYDEGYLLARIEYVLANRRLHDSESTRMGVEIFFSGRKFFITSDRLQILNLLLSTYEGAVQRNRELASARDDLRNLNENLEAKVTERTSALETEVQERKRAEQEVRRLNTALEERVRERTAQLEAANKELEAFSYSVSHDLRAPLRHISGFVGLLSNRAAGVLDERSLEYLNTITNSARQMGCLIDDLLAFAKMNQTEIVRKDIDTGALIQGIIRELQPEMNQRQVDWMVASLPKLQADPAMIRQVFVNLLANAVKYTRPREKAEIEIGVQNTPAEIIFFVRDNGVGFDMKYADKLFGVFQRLHKSSEFEGTGIGLANVLRIVTRHGGRAWAESKVNEGATFYFTLPISRVTQNENPDIPTSCE
jgi:two-component system, sensor histidine kinase and response regulator